MNQEVTTIKPDQAKPAKAQPMSRSRTLMVYGLFLILLGGHAYCVKINGEYWPLSNYPMYSLRHWRTWDSVYLVGVSLENPSQEVPISYFVYDRPISVKSSMQTMSREKDRDPDKGEQLSESLLGLGQIYRGKRGGNRKADYQPINAIRLYSVTWTIVAEDGKREAKQIKRELIMEAKLPDVQTDEQEELAS